MIRRRAEKDISPQELARLAEVPLQTIKKLESGRGGTREDRLKRICAVLEIALEEAWNVIYQDQLVPARVPFHSAEPDVVHTLSRLISAVTKLPLEEQRNFDDQFIAIERQVETLLKRSTS
jgi:transcriptional regulator with XRE-family HTH domain